MKKILLSVSVLTSLFANSQVNDQVSVAAGYANQSYYSLDNGEVSNITNQDWDLAFDVSAFGSAIRTNGVIGVELYVTPYALSDWATIDTAGMSSWTRNMDSETSWSMGAFNADYDSNNASDLGWGEYNSITHFVVGNKTFVIKFSDGTAKKVLIEQLGSGTYTFKYSDLDNTNEVTETIVKSTYSGKNFVYYSIATGTTIDHEPASADWDIVFGKYIADLGMPYGVTGVLMNYGVTVYKDETVETNTATLDNNATYNGEINTIGYNWKSFNMSTYTYDLNDSATYFIQTLDGEVWKLGFTGFGGSSNGNIEFTKEQVAFLSIDNNAEVVSINSYPNPVTNELFIESDINGQATLMLNSINGQQVLNEIIEFTDAPISLGMSNYNEGTYILTIQFENGKVVNEKIIITK